MDGVKNSLVDQILANLNSLNETIKNIEDLVTQTPSDFSTTIYAAVEKIASAIIPIAIVLAVMFFVIELCKQSVMMEIVTWEAVAKLLLKLVLAKVMIQSSFWLLESIFAYTADIVSVIEHGAINVTIIDRDKITDITDYMGMMEVLALLISTAPLNLILMAVGWVVKLIVYGRVIELYILFAVSPLPIATLAGEGVHDVAKKFFQHFVAVCMQGIIIIIAIGIFSGFITETFTAPEGDILKMLGEYVFISLMLALTLYKSSAWSKQVVGLM